MKQLKIVFILLLLNAGIGIVRSQSIKSIIYKDGSFDLIGTSVKITNCYPALDNQSLKVLSVKTSEKGTVKTIQYQLIDGMLELQFGYEGSALTIKTKLSGQTTIPEIISPLHDALVTGANRIYRTPMGISGNGGIKDWPESNMKNSDCSSITGLLPDSGSTLVISTRDYKKYASFTNVYPTQMNGGKRLIDVCMITEKVSVNDIPTFYFTENSSAYEAMRNEAVEAAKLMGVKNDKPQSYHWCSWYYAYFHLSNTMVTDYLKGFESVVPEVPIQTFQIDAGFFPHLGDWLEPSYQFPNGIQASVKEIMANNYKAGIWIGPYMVGNKSKLFASHPDWILRRNDGSPIIQMTFYGEENLWGAMDEEIYVLDTSNPAVMDYLRSVFRAFKQMGISFFKTDFMYYGAEASNHVKRFTPGKTANEYQRELFEMIRQEIGPESYWLGCIAPFPVMLGYVDGMRVAGDISPKWVACTNMFDETRGAQHINNVWWQNDADALILRSKYNQLTDTETESIAHWVSMLGGVINTSDLFHEIPKERVDLFRFLEPGNIKYTSGMPFVAASGKLEVLVRQFPEKKAWAVFFLNRKDEKVTETFSLKSLVGLTKATCFDWNRNGAKELGTLGNLNIELNTHESRLIYVSEDGQSPGKLTLGGK